MTVMPAPTCNQPHHHAVFWTLLVTLQGVLGIARTTIVEDGTHDLSWAIVTPAQMEMTSLPSSASAMPSSERIARAMFGFELQNESERGRVEPSTHTRPE